MKFQDQKSSCKSQISISQMMYFAGPGMLKLLTILDLINEFFSDRETHLDVIDLSTISINKK